MTFPFMNLDPVRQIGHFPAAGADISPLVVLTSAPSAAVAQLRDSRGEFWAEFSFLK